MGRKKKEIPATYGGQAVVEGVMMRGKDHYCVAVRNPAGGIETRTGQVVQSKFTTVVGKVPILRGIVRLGSSMMVGMKVMTASAEISGLDDTAENASKFDKWLERKFGDKLGNFIIILAVIMSLGFSVALFMVLPTWLSSFATPLLGEHLWALGIIEGLTRLAIFMVYLIIISRIKDIRRVFQYHGAEHKVINCYEAGEELTPDCAKRYGRLHRRCGTSFLLFVMLISMIFFLFVNTDTVWLRVASRILFVPFIAGISFEVIRWAGISKSPIVKVLSWPGFMLQKITTAEPDERQMEVAIAALNGVLAAENVKVVENDTE
ncbi:MAG: DUF1385 domain-containing protein [Defluviitaleaceae bacterium]|nr:DUF1385 domain-containing protein [Defluviitaleaceae bacterium]